MTRFARLWPATSIAAALSAAILAAPAISNQPSGATHAVQIEGFAYDPKAQPVQIGDTVSWTNHDIVPHTVTAEDGSWDSGEIAPGATWTMTITDETFTEAEGGYFCGYHPVMRSRLENAPR